MTIKLAALSALLAVIVCTPAFAQSVQIDRGLMTDKPYTFIYPASVEKIPVGGAIVARVEYPGVAFRCDAVITPDGPADWDVDVALAALDKPAIEAEWAENYPGFTITKTSRSIFQSGPAVRFEGESTGSPLGVPAYVVYTSAVDGGRTYAVRCTMDVSLKSDAQDLYNFISANFSVRADGECCIDPSIFRPEPSGE